MKKNLLTSRAALAAVCLGAFSALTAQTPFLSWAKHTGGTSFDYANSVATDAAGNVYTCGVFRTTADFDPGTGVSNLTSAGADDAFISKVDASGNFVWAVNVGGTGVDGATAIDVDALGNVYVTGYFTGTADFDPGAGILNLTSTNVDAAFVLKLNPSGSLAWAGKVGGNMNVRGAGLDLDVTDHVLVTGNFGGTCDFDPGAGTSNLIATGNNDPFVVKLDSSGAHVWSVAFIGTGNDFGTAVTTDAQGNVYTTGYFSSTTDFNPGSGIANLTAAVTDIFVSKLDASGSYVWAKSMGGTGSDFGSSIAVDASGNVLTTGSFDGTADFDPGAGTYTFTASTAISDIFVSKLDVSGNFVWAAQMGGSSVDAGLDIWTDSLGAVYTTGKFSGTADFNPDTISNTLTVGGGYDLFVSKLNSAGQYVFAVKASGTNSEYGNSICVNSDGSIVVAGYFAGTTDFDPTAGSSTLTSTGQDDVCIIKYSQSGVGVPEITISEFKAYPSPGNGLITLTSENGFDEASVSVYSSEGKLVQRLQKQNGTALNLDLTSFGKGLYTLQIIEGEKTEVIKVIVH